MLCISWFLRIVKSQYLGSYENSTSRNFGLSGGLPFHSAAKAVVRARISFQLMGMFEEFPYFPSVLADLISGHRLAHGKALQAQPITLSRLRHQLRADIQSAMQDAFNADGRISGSKKNHIVAKRTTAQALT